MSEQIKLSGAATLAALDIFEDESEVESWDGLVRVPYLAEMIDRRFREREAQVDALVAAARLTVQHFKRSQASGNFLGDDEHEAWTALNAALEPFA